MKRYTVDLSYVIQYDEKSALPGIENLYSKGELKEPVYSCGWDYYWAQDEKDALNQAVKKLFDDVFENRLCEHGSVRILKSRVVERSAEK